MSKKKTYYIVHTEKLVGHYLVRASSAEEAYTKFIKAANNGEVDYSDLLLEDSKNEVFSEKVADFDDAIEVIIDEDEEDDNDEC